MRSVSLRYAGCAEVSMKYSPQIWLSKPKAQHRMFAAMDEHEKEKEKPSTPQFWSWKVAAPPRSP